MLFESEYKNMYFYDPMVKNTQWCHPVLNYIIKLHDRALDIEQWYANLTEAPIQINDYGPVSKAEVTYYYHKYKLLRENGFFLPPDTEHLLSGRLSPTQIKSSLANTRQVTFEVVDYCNLDCAYCAYGKFYNSNEQRGNKQLSTGTAKTVLNYLHDLLNSSLNQSHHQAFYIGFYGGEPLLNFSFIRDIAAYARQLKLIHNYFRFNMTTNGLLLGKYMDFLVEHDFDLLISLDGDEYNNSYRIFRDGKPAYPEILKNIDALAAKYPNYFKNNVNFNSVIHNRNTVPGLHHYFKTRFAKIPSITELNPTGIAPAMRDEFRKTYANIGATLFQAEDYSLLEKDMFLKLPNIRGMKTFLQQCSGFIFNDYNDVAAAGNKTNDGKPTKQTAQIPTGTCIPFSRKIFITVQGKILPCERIGQQYSLGTADEKKIDLDFEKIAGIYNSYFDHLKKQCCSCANWEACLQCIFYLNIDQPQPHCSGLLNDEEFAQYLSTQLSYLEKNPQTYRKVLKEVRLV
ncbi:MAG TPA: radical SAM peptide maturase [Candidatus Deferrimicrobium sp.]|nr:radical SAM peptide maturase [Candidatus Deferrimicrobium sp.]